MKLVLFLIVLLLFVGFAFAVDVNFFDEVFELNDEGSVDSDFMKKDPRFSLGESFCVAEARGEYGVSFDCVLFREKVVFLGGRNITLGDFDSLGGVVLVDDVSSNYFEFGESYLEEDYDVDVFYVDSNLKFVFADFYFGSVGIKIKKDLNNSLGEELIVVNELDKNRIVKVTCRMFKVVCRIVEVVGRMFVVVSS